MSYFDEIFGIPLSSPLFSNIDYATFVKMFEEAMQKTTRSTTKFYENTKENNKSTSNHVVVEARVIDENGNIIEELKGELFRNGKRI